MTGSALPILMYHHVCPEPGLVTITPQHFADQMAWLAKAGYHTASCADLVSFLHGDELPSRTVMLTFDDGYLDNYVHAYPTLKRLGLHAVVFAVTDWIGNGEPRAVAGEAGTPQLLNHRECTERIRSGRSDEAIMRWSEVERTLAAGAFEYQSHTASHARWDKIYSGTNEKSEALARDIERSKTTLLHRIGLEGKHLCWPQGYYDGDYLTVAHQLGFDCLYTTHHGTVCRDDDPALLPRIVVKDKGAVWLASRIHLYSSPRLARWYGRIKGL